MRRRICFLAAGIFVLSLSTANATLEVLKPNPTDPATFVGNGGVSTDGLGQNGVGGTIQAEVPSGSTVEQAYLFGTYYSAPTAADLAIDFDGTIVDLVTISNVNSLFTARAEVTAQVAAKVVSGGGITDFAVNSDPIVLDGVALVVIYSNPTSPIITVAVLNGSASQTGDVATFNFSVPLDKTVPGFVASMAVGSGFSFQGVDGNICGSVGQYSIIDINGALLTQCAGNYDDGFGNNGALITVGGVGDSLDNPTPPEAPPTDDELYNLEPLLNQGDGGVTITTSNPSQDDNLFLAVIAITAEATVTTEVCDDGIDNDGDGLIDLDDPDCQLPPAPEICDDGIDNDGDGLIDVDDPDCQTLPNPESQKMTGGGWIKEGGMKVRHGFNLRCDFETPGMGGRLQVTWGGGNKFHLTDVTETTCTDTDGIDEEKPVAGFDTITGTGTGRYNGEDGATVEFVFSDGGEPGKGVDGMALLIRDAGGSVVLDVDKNIKRGNQQAHP